METRWEKVETYLVGHHNQDSEFSNADYAVSQGVDTAEATMDIKAYLDAQRRKNSRTKYVLHRKPGTRTSKAKWLVGERAKDARQIGDGLFDDVKTRIMKGFAPDLTRLMTLNPRAGRLATRQLTSMVEHIIPLLENAVLGEFDDDE